MKTKLNVIFLVIAIVAVAAVVIAGFLVIGSPANQRKIAVDDKRLQDLSSLAQSLNNQAKAVTPNATGSAGLPATLADLVQITGNQYLNVKDPETGAAYTYQIISSSTYNLCATFETDSKTSPSNAPGSSPVNIFWNHPAGNYCFSFNTAQYPPSYYYDGPAYPVE
jgi:outer membrane murein-binding lipoprotein Lpp